jgi:hypothetical protein
MDAYTYFLIVWESRHLPIDILVQNFKNQLLILEIVFNLKIAAHTSNQSVDDKWPIFKINAQLIIWISTHVKHCWWPADKTLFVG